MPALGKQALDRVTPETVQALHRKMNGTRISLEDYRQSVTGATVAPNNSIAPSLTDSGEIQHFRYFAKVEMASTARFRDDLIQTGQPLQRQSDSIRL